MPSEAHELFAQLIGDNPIPSDTPLAQRRAGFDGFLLSMPLAHDVDVDTADADGVPVDWVSIRGTEADRVVLLVHGGGYCMGSSATYREFASRLARATAARVAVADYRLAPEAPFPAAVDDVLAVYRWLLAEGTAGGSIAVMADSGGVGLALAAVGRARDTGLELPAAVVGFTPWVDLAVGDAIADEADVGDPMNTRAGMAFYAREYLQAHPPTDPSANVLHGDLRGFPPLLVLAGTRDINYGDALRLARAARAADVPVTVRAFHGLIHNWQLAAQVPEAAEAVAVAAAFVDEHLARMAAA